MASYRKLPSGKYEFSVKGGGFRKSKTFKTVGQGRAWAAEMELQLGRGNGLAGDHTVGELFIRYADEVSNEKRGSRWEIVRLKKFGQQSLAELRLKNLSREDIEAWIDEQLKTGLQPSSINRELNLISHCLTQARRWRWMDHNPMEDLKRPKNPPARDRRISSDEVEKILVALGYDEKIPVVTKRQQVALAFLFAIETAMRAGEICALKSINKEDRTAYLAQTKNGHARIVPLTKEAVRLWERLPEDGFALTSGVLSTYFRTAVIDAGIDNLTFHDTRHEAITRLAKKIGVLDLARATGHKNIKELQTYYNSTAAEISKLLD